MINVEILCYCYKSYKGKLFGKKIITRTGVKYYI